MSLEARDWTVAGWFLHHQHFLYQMSGNSVESLLVKIQRNVQGRVTELSFLAPGCSSPTPERRWGENLTLLMERWVVCHPCAECCVSSTGTWKWSVLPASGAASQMGSTRGVTVHNRGLGNGTPGWGQWQPPLNTEMKKSYSIFFPVRTV